VQEWVVFKSQEKGLRLHRPHWNGEALDLGFHTGGETPGLGLRRWGPDVVFPDLMTALCTPVTATPQSPDPTLSGLEAC
jgi:hypothetical protein